MTATASGNLAAIAHSTASEAANMDRWPVVRWCRFRLARFVAVRFDGGFERGVFRRLIRKQANQFVQVDLFDSAFRGRPR